MITMCWPATTANKKRGETYDFCMEYFLFQNITWICHFLEVPSLRLSFLQFTFTITCLFSNLINLISLSTSDVLFFFCFDVFNYFTFRMLQKPDYLVVDTTAFIQNASLQVRRLIFQCIFYFNVSYSCVFSYILTHCTWRPTYDLYVFLYVFKLLRNQIKLTLLVPTSLYSDVKNLWVQS